MLDYSQSSVRNGQMKSLDHYTAPLEASRELATLRMDPRFEEVISSVR
jgi:hypothetical protein